MLSPQAWNAFLKTLEEPPPNTVFVLATTEAQKILPMNAQAIAPSSAVQDPNEQIAQFDALFKANQIDCLSIP